jgi:hypothetical protein
LLIFAPDAAAMFLPRPNRFHFSTQFRPPTHLHS